MESGQQKNEIKPGCLYLVATPIGNLEDITFRAVRILSEVDLIAAEDTRTSGKLLSHYDIHTPLSAYHEHNKIEKIPSFLKKLQEGESIAVITDAGTPGISDPGEELAAACIENEIEVFSVPGAVAAITAVTSSGLSCRRFAFEAFLPKKKKLRQQVLKEIQAERRTVVLYEAPHHLKSTLKELETILGQNRRIVLCRELTKRFEEKRMLTLHEAVCYCDEKEPRGEYVLVIEGKTKEEVENENNDRWLGLSIEDHYAQYIEEGMDRKAAMKQVAIDRGIRKKDVYDVVAR